MRTRFFERLIERWKTLVAVITSVQKLPEAQHLQ